MSEDIFDRIMALPGLRMLYKPYRKHKQVLLYAFFGALTTVVSVGSFLLFETLLGINELVANVLSWVLAVAFAYATNRKWVFCSQTRGNAFWKELFSFYSGRLLTLGLEEGMLLVFVTWLSFPSLAVKLAAQIVVLIGNYVISKFLVFRKKQTGLL